MSAHRGDISAATSSSGIRPRDCQRFVYPGLTPWAIFIPPLQGWYRSVRKLESIPPRYRRLHPM